MRKAAGHIADWRRNGVTDASEGEGFSGDGIEAVRKIQRQRAPAGKGGAHEPRNGFRRCGRGLNGAKGDGVSHGGFPLFRVEAITVYRVMRDDCQY